MLSSREYCLLEGQHVVSHSRLQDFCFVLSCWYMQGQVDFESPEEPALTRAWLGIYGVVETLWGNVVTQG